MSNSRINSPEGLRLGTEVVRAFGSWDAAERASYRNAEGVHVIRRSRFPAPHGPTATPVDAG